MSKQESVIVKLKHPISQGSETVTEVEVFRMKGKHLRGIADPSHMDSQLKIIGRVIDRNPKFVDELDGDDISAIGEAMGDFLESGRAGKTSTE